MRAKMSIAGLYEYDPTIFDNFHVPEEMVEGGHRPYYDKDFYISRIIFEAMDLELVYPNPTYMKRAIQIWSLGKLNVWHRIAEALFAYYNPIENYNRSETWTDTDSRTENWTDTDSHTDSWTHGSGTTDSGTVDVKRTDNLKAKTTGNNRSDTNSTTTDDETDTNSAVAYNTNTWKNNTKTVVEKVTEDTRSQVDSINSTVENTGTQDTKTTNNLHHDIEENGLSTISGSVGRTGSTGGSVTHTGNVSGNIGVTTSQQMVNQEMELRKQNQLIEIVVRDFIETFCILVY